MRKIKRITILIVCILALLPAATLADTGEGYTIDHYEVTVELAPDSVGELRDAAVTMSITYNISGTPKSSLCKFIGQIPVKDVSVNDGDDKPLKFELEEFNEHKLTWHFPEVKQGQQTIVAHFTVVGALEGSLAENLLYFEWVEYWEVPVRDVVYRFILPEKYTYEKLTMYPGNESKQLTEYKGRRAVETHLAGVGDNALQVRFSPGIAEGPSRPARRSLMTQGCTTPTQQPTNIMPGLIVASLIIIIGVGFVSFVRWQARRGVRYGDADVIAAAGTASFGNTEAALPAIGEAIQKSYDARPDQPQRLVDASVQGHDRTGPMMVRIPRAITMLGKDEGQKATILQLLVKSSPRALGSTIGGAIGGAIGGIASGMVFGAIIAMVLGGIAGATRGIEWAIDGVINGLLSGAFSGGALVGAIDSGITGIITGAIAGVVGGVVIGAAGGVNPDRIEWATEGVIDGVQDGLAAGIVYGLIVLLMGVTMNEWAIRGAQIAALNSIFAGIAHRVYRERTNIKQMFSARKHGNP